LQISVKRKKEIEDNRKAASIMQKLQGFNDARELELFLIGENQNEYKVELKFKKPG
jgi:hypothetical protein